MKCGWEGNFYPAFFVLYVALYDVKVKPSHGIQYPHNNHYHLTKYMLSLNVKLLGTIVN